MSASGDGNDEIGQPADVAKVVDVSMAGVNARLRAFIGEVRGAEARGERRPFAESDVLLAAMAEDALRRQEEAERRLAELERRELESRGGPAAMTRWPGGATRSGRTARHERRYESGGVAHVVIPRDVLKRGDAALERRAPSA